MVGHEVEMDETYVTHCRKGRIIDGHPGKKRGTPATKRGLSDEKICILTAVQRLGKCMARSSMWQSHLPWMRKLSVNV